MLLVASASLLVSKMARSRCIRPLSKYTCWISKFAVTSVSGADVPFLKAICGGTVAMALKRAAGRNPSGALTKTCTAMRSRGQSYRPRIRRVGSREKRCAIASAAWSTEGKGPREICPMLSRHSWMGAGTDSPAPMVTKKKEEREREREREREKGEERAGDSDRNGRKWNQGNRTGKKDWGNKRAGCRVYTRLARAGREGAGEGGRRRGGEGESREEGRERERERESVEGQEGRGTSVSIDLQCIHEL